METKKTAGTSIEWAIMCICIAIVSLGGIDIGMASQAGNLLGEIGVDTRTSGDIQETLIKIFRIVGIIVLVGSVAIGTYFVVSGLVTLAKAESSHDSKGNTTKLVAGFMLIVIPVVIGLVAAQLTATAR